MLFFKLMGKVSVKALVKAVETYPEYPGFNAILGNKQRKELETLLETMSEGAEWPECAEKLFAMITGPAQGEKQVADSGADPLLAPVAPPSSDSSKDVATQTQPSASADGATQTGNSADSGVAAIAPASVGSVSPMPVGSSSS